MTVFVLNALQQRCENQREKAKRSSKLEKPVLFSSSWWLMYSHEHSLQLPTTASGVHSLSADQLGQNCPRLDVSVGIGDRCQVSSGFGGGGRGG